MELNSMSKSFNMAGWRVGMLSGNAENIQAVLKVKSKWILECFMAFNKGRLLR